MPSTKHDMALAFLESFTDLDGPASIALRTADCIHTMGPTSLFPSSPHNLTNEAFLAHIASLKEVLTVFPVKAEEIFEDERSSHVTIWATSHLTFRPEVIDHDEEGTDWSYHGEYMFVLTFNEAGDKIERIVEFLDSQKVVAVRPLLARAKRNLAASKAKGEA